MNEIFEREKFNLSSGWRNRLNVPFNNNLCYFGFSIHVEIQKFLNNKNFIDQNGLYFICLEWFWDWMEIAIKRSSKLEEQLLSGVDLYSKRVSNCTFQSQIVEIFKKYFDKWKFKYIKIENADSNIDSEKPFVVTTRVKTLWKKLNTAMMQNSPILVTGNEGCGKSQAIAAYAAIFGASLFKVCLTPESEPSVLVGSLMPNDKTQKTSERIVWQDGAITEAIKNSNWVLLDNLNQAESPVLERLNPVLEDPPIWILAENGETESMNFEDGFRIFATMSVASKGSSSQQSYGELSPALYNRFTIIHYDDINLNDEKSFKSEISELTDRMVRTLDKNQKQKLENLLWVHSNKCQQNRTAVTFRNFVIMSVTVITISGNITEYIICMLFLTVDSLYGKLILLSSHSKPILDRGR